MSAVPIPRGPETPATPFAATLARVMDLGVKVSDPDDVLEYLAGHADTAAVLGALCDEVRREFGPDCELALRVYRDPEIRDEYLALYVRQWPYGARLMERLHAISGRFERDLCDGSGWILLTSDFRKPEFANGGV